MINKNYQIVILSEDYPGNGGFGTGAFKLQMYLKKHNIDSLIIYFTKIKNVPIEQKQLDNIIYIFINNYYDTLEQLSQNGYHKIPNLNNYINKNTIVILRSYYTNIIFDNLKLKYKIKIHFCGNIMYNQIDYNVTVFNQISRVFHMDKKSVKCNNNNKFNIGNSELTLSYLNTFSNNNIICSNFIVSSDNDIYTEGYDLIFITSDVVRVDKNYDLLCEIYNHYPHLNKIIIGKNSTKTTLKNTTTYEFLSNDKVVNLLKKTKLCLIPSLKDAGPNVFIEAITNYCIPIISFNVGFHLINNNKYKFSCDFKLKSWMNTIDELLINYTFDKHYFSGIIKYFKSNEMLFIDKLNNFIDKPQIPANTYDIFIYNDKTIQEFYKTINHTKKYVVLLTDIIYFNDYYMNFNNEFQINIVELEFNNIVIIKTEYINSLYNLILQLFNSNHFYDNVYFYDTVIHKINQSHLSP